MSGICGIVSLDARRLQTSDVSSMVRHLKGEATNHCGEDCWGPVGFGFARRQGYDAGIVRRQVHGVSVAVAYHGKLYRLKELSSLSEARSDLFEGLLDQYLELGTVFLKKLCGEYVLAIWDGRDESLYLATDRFRVEPLFYYSDAEKLVFASHMKGIVNCPLEIVRTVNPKSIVDIMAFSSVCSPRTIFHEVNKLSPGHVLSCRGGRIWSSPYWDIDFSNTSSANEVELQDRLKAVFADAVSKRLESESRGQRIGAFLSGGIDSSTVTGVLTHLMKSPVESFSIGFEEDRFNEIEYARMAAKHFGSDHHEYFVKPQDLTEALPVLMDAFDEPFANASAVPVYFCAKLARQYGIDVLYAGDGGDELFAGNERYGTQRLFDYYSQLPEWIRKWVAEPLIFSLADYVGGKYIIGAKKYIRRANIPYPQRLSSYGLFNVLPMNELLGEKLLEVLGDDYDPYSPVSFYYSEARAGSELDKQLYIDLKLTIGDSDLLKVVRMTEAAGVAVRFPFLDQDFAEFAAAVPASYKMRGTHLRTFFKNAYADMLPSAIRHKIKHGFGLPIPIWLKTIKPLNEMMHDLVLGSRCVQRGYFSKKALELLIQHHRSEESSFYGTVLWNVMILELWHRQYCDNKTISLTRTS